MFYIKRFPTIETTSKTLRLEKPTVSFAALFLVVHRLNFVFPKSGIAYNYRCIDCSSQEASKIHFKKKEKRDIVLCHGNQRVRRTCKHTGSISLDILCLHCRNLGFQSSGKGAPKIRRATNTKGLWQKQEIGTLR